MDGYFGQGNHIQGAQQSVRRNDWASFICTCSFLFGTDFDWETLFSDDKPSREDALLYESSYQKIS
jgi:hypothetical protein